MELVAVAQSSMFTSSVSMSFAERFVMTKGDQTSASHYNETKKAELLGSIMVAMF